jgi:hypothetical protein
MSEKTGFSGGKMPELSLLPEYNEHGSLSF